MSSAGSFFYLRPRKIVKVLRKSKSYSRRRKSSSSKIKVNPSTQIPIQKIPSTLKTYRKYGKIEKNIGIKEI